MEEKNADQQSDVAAAHSRGIYLLPNLFTTAVLFGGFYAIVAAMRGHFTIAAIAIVVAGIADTLDGRIARLTNTQTAFGAQYDSLSDMVASGLAPALVIYSWSLSYLGKLGWVIAFLFAAATALRLARFNAQLDDDDKHSFQGLPCPPAAGCIAATVWVGSKYDVQGLFAAVPAALLTLILAILMVSTVRYQSFKHIDLKSRKPFFVVFIPILVITAIALNPSHVLFFMSIVYVCSGPVMTLWQLRKARQRKRMEKTSL